MAGRLYEVEIGEGTVAGTSSRDVGVEGLTESPGASRLTVPLPGSTEPTSPDVLPVPDGGAVLSAKDNKDVRAANSADAPVGPLAEELIDNSL